MHYKPESASFESYYISQEIGQVSSVHIIIWTCICYVQRHVLTWVTKSISIWCILSLERLKAMQQLVVFMRAISLHSLKQAIIITFGMLFTLWIYLNKSIFWVPFYWKKGFIENMLTAWNIDPLIIVLNTWRWRIFKEERRIWSRYLIFFIKFIRNEQ